MKKLKKIVYDSADDIDARAAAREREAEQMVPGSARQSILREIAQLRAYADMKRCLAPARR